MSAFLKVRRGLLRTFFYFLANSEHKSIQETEENSKKKIYFFKNGEEKAK